MYKVRWKGFTENEDTWEPYSSLTEPCDRLIMDYEMSQAAQECGGAADQPLPCIVFFLIREIIVAKVPLLLPHPSLYS
ncbi:unnamed protein product [Gongylonema pulchrum]|uniref:Chromo domain-containing protein n=1 Tax=Gongylonema pulchrum TaxID=637853 RepID=A0A183DSA7_9BILA|nr:unnamed protein product [Gongylonema pulchrum]